MHACDYLLTVDMEMDVVEGYKFANWEKGYGDFHCAPDFNTLRQLTWLDKSALIICDLQLEPEHAPVAVAPRSMLKRQIAKLTELGFAAKGASELEYYLFKETFDSAKAKNYQNLETFGWYIEDYHMLQGTKEEVINAAIRRQMEKSGIPIESSKGEWGPGQHEINFRYSDVLEMADRDTLVVRYVDPTDPTDTAQDSVLVVQFTPGAMVIEDPRGNTVSIASIGDTLYLRLTGKLDQSVTSGQDTVFAEFFDNVTTDVEEVMLLEVLRSDEHAFRPDHAIVPGHGGSDCLLGRAGWGNHDVGAHRTHIEADLVFGVLTRRHVDHRAPLRAVEFAVAHQQTDLACGRVEVALNAQLLAGLDRHFVLVQQVQAQGRLRAVGQGEIVGTGKGGGVLQFENPHPYRRGLAIGAGVEPGNRMEVQLDRRGIGVSLGGGVGFGGIFGTRRQQQRGGDCE